MRPVPNNFVPIIQLEDVWKTYDTGVKVDALRGINLSIFSGEFLSIIGPSGSGKSTLLHLIGLLDTPTKGKVFVNGQEVSRLSDEELARLRNRYFGFVFQTFNLIPSLTALENVEVPMALAGIPKEERIKRAKELLEKLGLGNRLNHKPSQLSGGQKQRVAIARALANNPEVILADEPTGNLDSKSGEQVMEIFNQLHQEGKTLVIVTHDRQIASHAERKIYLKDGRIVKEE
jgi:putative ABC transport system ATP-binding protein